MTTFGIIDIYDNIIRSGGEYCKVCLRTARERRLVKPVSFTRFLNTVHRYKSIEDLRVCYICEGLARSAMQFYRAVTVGAALEDLFLQIHRGRLRADVVKHLSRETELPRGVAKVYHLATSCQQDYLAVRSATPHSLHCTDTLVVAVDSPRTEATANREAITELETIVLIDDESPPGSVMTDEQPLGSALTHKLRPAINVGAKAVTVSDPVTGGITKHPIVVGTDSNRYVPSLKIQLLPNNVFKSVPDKTLFDFTNTPIAHSAKPHQNSFSARPEKAINSDGGDYQAFLNMKSKEKNAVTMDELIQTKGMKIVLSFDEESIETSKRKKIEERDPLDLGSDSSVSVKVTSEPNSDEKSPREKRPILSMDRVDWEDKIPMDVISFMDATDPNPVERIMQPPAPPALGVISDVRTVQEDVHILGSVECIDLC